MKGFFLSVGLFLICISANAQSAQSKLDELMSAYAKQYKFNGAVLVSKGDQILLNKGYGIQDAADKINNDSATVFQLGSITKQFTAIMILKLQEQKKLNINDKLSKYFPSYPKGDSITIKHLLTHTSGIYSYTNDATFMNNEITKPLNRKQVMALFENKPLEFSPGTKWEYSNSAYILLGFIIEDVTKMTYYQAARKMIFQPLGMTHTGFDFTNLSVREKAVGYMRINEQVQVKAPIVDSSVSFSAGAMYSTTSDLYKWYLSLKNNKIISAASKQMASTPVLNKYGFGLGIDSVDGKLRIAHGGGIHGFTTNISIVQADGICIVLLNNASNSFLSTITESIYAILYNKPYELPKERVAVSLSEDVLKQYEGEYELAPGFKLDIAVKSGKLTVHPTGQQEHELFAEKTDFFFLKVVDAQIEFKRNTANVVESLVLVQGGREMPGKKIK
ncbi:serine hydrolase [Pollutibacter soli]|uniref:serine hydrolase n=1 Tax=Pollutibacter soli TaxID=3034157 RepID=UPI003013D3D2